MLRSMLLLMFFFDVSTAYEQLRHFSNLSIWTVQADTFDNDMLLEGTAYSYCPTSRNYTIRVEMYQLQGDSLTTNYLVGTPVNMTITERKGYHVMMGKAYNDGSVGTLLQVFFRIEHNCPKTRKEVLGPDPIPFTYGFFPENGYIEVHYMRKHITHIYNMFWDLTAVARKYDVPVLPEPIEYKHEWLIQSKEINKNANGMILEAHIRSHCPTSSNYSIKIEMFDHDSVSSDDLIDKNPVENVTDGQGDHYLHGITLSNGISSSDGILDSTLDVYFTIEHNCPKTKQDRFEPFQIGGIPKLRPISEGKYPTNGYIKVDQRSGYKTKIYNILWDLSKIGTSLQDDTANNNNKVFMQQKLHKN